MSALSQLFKLLGLSAPFLYAGATFWLFHWLDKKASAQAKAAIRNWLQPHGYGSSSLATAMVELFDKIYGHPLFSVRSFLRSAAISITITTIVLYEFSGLIGQLLRIIVFGENTQSLMWPAVQVIIIAYVANITSDYVSLFVVRYGLKSASGSPLLAMFIAPLVGAIVVVALTYAQISALKEFVPSRVVWVLGDLKMYVRYLSSVYGAIAVLAWLPLFGTSAMLLRATDYLLLAAQKMQWFLKRGRDHPLQALGIVASVVVLCIAAVIRVIFG
jgi:hypothetical protein